MLDSVPPGCSYQMSNLVAILHKSRRTVPGAALVNNASRHFVQSYDTRNHAGVLKHMGKQAYIVGNKPCEHFVL